MATRSVVMYSRPGCHLCDQAREVIESVRSRVPFRFSEIDIDASDELTREYGIKIPVIAVDGEDRWEYRVDAADLEAALRAV